jgi:angio-associated migratory cell protein
LGGCGPNKVTTNKKLTIHHVHAGGMDGTIKIWDLGTFNCRHVCQHEGGAGVTKLQWHVRLPLVYTAATDGALRLWDARSGALLQTLTGHEDMVVDFALACGEGPGGRGDVLVTGSDDNTAKVWCVNLEG